MQHICCVVQHSCRIVVIVTKVRVDPRIEHTRRVVLGAAVEVVAERGFAGASIDAVARRSGVARSTIYRHWPNRMDLLLEAVSGHVRPVESYMSGDVRADLINVVLDLGSLMGTEPMGSVAAALISESRHDPQLEAMRLRFLAERQRGAAILLAEARSQGLVSDDVSPMDLAADLGAAVFFTSLVMRREIDRPWAEAHVDRWLARYAPAP